MPSGNNLINNAVSVPIQMVAQVGKSGDRFNMFRAPDSIARYVGDVPALGTVTLVPAVANRALRIYRYILSTVNPGVLGANVVIRTRWGNPPVTTFMYHQAAPVAAGLAAVGYWTVDLSPCGVMYSPNVAFSITNDNVFINGVCAIVLYSTESWGLASGSDGIDIG